MSIVAASRRSPGTRTEPSRLPGSGADAVRPDRGLDDPRGEPQPSLATLVIPAICSAVIDRPRPMGRLPNVDPDQVSRDGPAAALARQPDAAAPASPPRASMLAAVLRVLARRHDRADVRRLARCRSACSPWSRGSRRRSRCGRPRGCLPGGRTPAPGSRCRTPGPPHRDDLVHRAGLVRACHRGVPRVDRRGREEPGVDVRAFAMASTSPVFASRTTRRPWPLGPAYSASWRCTVYCRSSPASAAGPTPGVAAARTGCCRG